MSNMEKQKTAVEWLIDKLDIILPLDFEWDKLEKSFKQAKQMEKEQIENAYWDGGQDIPTTAKRCEQYYNGTFKK
jgi:hypothetical protein